MGSGRQWFSWVHEQDLLEIYLFLVKQAQVSGPVNCTAPFPVRNREMTRILGEALDRSIILPSVPGFMIRLLMGEFGSVLVKDQNGHMVGILTERDIVRGFADEPDNTFDETAADLMTTKVVTATPSTPLMELLHLMTEGRFRHVPVLDGDHIAGLISIGDVVKFRLRELEYEALKLKQMIVG